MARFLFTLVSCLGAVWAPATPQEVPLVLQGGRVLTGTGEDLPRGTVVIQGGRILAVGASVAVPPGAQVVDCRGRVLHPGLIDAGAVVGLLPTDRTLKRGGRSVVDGLDGFAHALRRSLAGGVTAAFVSPDPYTPPLGTVGAVIKLRPGRPPAELVLRARAGVRARFGLAGAERFDPVAQRRSFAALVQALKGARAYAEARRKKEEALKKWREALRAWRRKVGLDEKTGEPRGKKKSPRKKSQGARKKTSRRVPRRPRKPSPFREDPVKEALLAALEGEIPLRIVAHGRRELEWALEVKRTFGCPVAVEGASGAGGLAQELAAAGVVVVAGPLLYVDRREPAYADFRPEDLRRLREAGVTVVLASASLEPAATRDLRWVAAYAAGHGLGREGAFAAVTREAARFLGVADRIGTLAPGKDADLVIATAHPLDPDYRVVGVLVNGTWEIRP